MVFVFIRNSAKTFNDVNVHMLLGVQRLTQHMEGDINDGATQFDELTHRGYKE